MSELVDILLFTSDGSHRTSVLMLYFRHFDMCQISDARRPVHDVFKTILAAVNLFLGCFSNKEIRIVTVA